MKSTVFRRTSNEVFVLIKKNNIMQKVSLCACASTKY